MVNNDDPFNIASTTIECPFDDGVKLSIEFGWINRNYPVLHINAPKVLQHLRENHGHN